MADTISYASCNDDLNNLMAAAAAGKADSIVALTQTLRQAEPTCSDDWEPAITRFWINGLETVAQALAGATLPAEMTELIRAMLIAGLDSAILRALYEQLVRQQYPDSANPDGLLAALGLKQEDIKLNRIALKWDVLSQLKPGAWYYERALGTGEVLSYDDVTNEVKIKDTRKHSLSLKIFLDSVIIVKGDTPLHKWLKEGKVPETKIPADELEKEVRSSVFTAANLPMNLTRAFLVPRCLTDTKLKNLTTINANEKNTGADQTNSWDASRSIQELTERLRIAIAGEISLTPETACDNVSNILKATAAREEHAGLFALSLAILQENLGDASDWLKTVIGELSENAVVWNDDELFAEVSDKLPGKQIPAWFKVTKIARGAEYLIDHTFTLPFKLWTHTEKILLPKDEQPMFHDKVEETLKTGKCSADMLFWVWKSKYDDLKGTYLVNSPLLFKTLLKEVKGSYLKAQRDLHRMLLSDDKFQRQLMNNGEEKYVASLIRSAKTMTLLTKDERQSLLVQIVRIYPQFISLVEEKKTTSERAVIPQITSARSYKLRQLALDTIINKLIPENRRAIETARDFGDLRENSEFKFAKERQRFLNQRRSDLERTLSSGIRIVDFSNIDSPTNVVPGCTVVLKFADGSEQHYHILGVLDTNPEKNILSFETLLAKSVLYHKRGDEIETPDGKKAVISTISALSDDLLDWLAGEPEESELQSLLA